MNGVTPSLGVVAKVYVAAGLLYLLVAYAVQIHYGVLDDVWFEMAWGFAFGAMQAAGINMVKDTLVALKLVQSRAAPQHDARFLAHRLFRLQIISVFLGLSVLMVISHMKLDEHEAQVHPWLLPAFLWACTPLCMWAVMVWNRPVSWGVKILTALLVTAFVIGHRAFAFQWSAVLGDALVWALWMLGAAGLVGANCFLRQKQKWTIHPTQDWMSKLKLWVAPWWGKTLHVGVVGPGLYIFISSWFFSENSGIRGWVKIWDAPDLAAANVFLPTRCYLLTGLMLASLCSARAHWRWELLPGSGFRKHSGTEIFKTTATYWLMLGVVISMLLLVIPRIWQPDVLSSLRYAFEWRVWPYMVDGLFALGAAVWLRSVSWSSWMDIAAMFGLWLSLMFVYPKWAFFERSIEQDVCMLLITWLMVQRANKNFETFNRSWLTYGH